MLNFLKKLTKPKSEARQYDWYHDRINGVQLQRNFLIFVSVTLLVAIIVMSISVLSISNLREIQPFVVEISQKSGVATVVDSVSLKKYSADRKLAEYFLVKYLQAREGFDPLTYQSKYYTDVRLLSSGSVYNDFKNYIRLGNQSSPLNLYVNSSVSVKIRSIQYLDIGSVQIRFMLEIKDTGRQGANKPPLMKAKIATIEYTYNSDVVMNEDERYVNPLGFVINTYRVDDEYL